MYDIYFTESCPLTIRKMIITLSTISVGMHLYSLLTSLFFYFSNRGMTSSGSGGIHPVGGGSSDDDIDPELREGINNIM